MAQPYFCGKCKFETGEPMGTCPQCGRTLSKTSTIRLLGWALVLPGGLLAAGMTVLTVNVARMMGNAGDPGAGSRFTGDAGEAAVILAVLGSVIALSLSFVAAGAWQIIFGRRNKLIIVAVLALAAVVYLLGRAVTSMN
jgi:hypothetical protein